MYIRRSSPAQTSTARPRPGARGTSPRSGGRCGLTHAAPAVTTDLANCSPLLNDIICAHSYSPSGRVIFEPGWSSPGAFGGRIRHGHWEKPRTANLRNISCYLDSPEHTSMHLVELSGKNARIEQKCGLKPYTDDSERAFVGRIVCEPRE